MFATVKKVKQQMNDFQANETVNNSQTFTQSNYSKSEHHSQTIKDLDYIDYEDVKDK